MPVAAAVLVLGMLAPPTPAAGASDPVRNGLRWLASRQQADGRWDGRNDLAPTGITATAGLALLMEGSTPTYGEYAPHLRKAIGWFEATASDNGMLASKGTNEQYQYVFTHSQALLFLACAYDADDDVARLARVRKRIEKAVKFLLDRQMPRGGWPVGEPAVGIESDRSDTTAAALQALLAAGKAGFDVPKDVTDRAVLFLTRATTASGGVAFTVPGGRFVGRDDGQWDLSAAATAAVLMRDGPRPPAVAKWVARIVRADQAKQVQQLNQFRNYSNTMYAHLLVARAAYSLGDGGHRRLDPDARDDQFLRWSDHRARLFKVLAEQQSKDGSWPDINPGSAYPAATALVILQLDNGYVPTLAR